MLKGKTIQSIGSENSLIGMQPAKQSTLTPKKVISTIEVNEPKNQSSIENKIVKNEAQTKQEQEFIKPIKNLRYSTQFLKSKFPEFSNLYYIEIYDLLETTDFNLDENNLNLNLQKFINLGNNVQSQISRLNELLQFIPKNSFKQIKEKTEKEIGFFTSSDAFIQLFTNFNDEVFNYYNSLYIEIEKIKNLDFSKYDLVYLYSDFFKFICSELQNKNIASDEFISSSIIASRVVQLNNSITVLNQFKTLITVELQGKDMELSNLKDYLDILKPSLFLLKDQDFKSFKEQFKDLLK